MQPMNTNTLLFLSATLLLLMLTSSCDPAALLGPQASGVDKYKLRATYHRGACYGRCEVYSLEMYENGLLLFKGERFTDKPGTWEKNIDRRRITSLLDSFSKADFPNYPRSFRGQIPDAATVEIGYYDAAGTYYVTSFKDEAPQELGELSKSLDRLAHLPDYRFVSDTISTILQRPVAASAREEIIVQLAQGVVVENWVINYSKQNVQFKERISPNGNYYIITSDPNLMPSEELLDFLRRDISVVSAQLNQVVKPR